MASAATSSAVRRAVGLTAVYGNRALAAASLISTDCRSSATSDAR